MWTMSLKIDVCFKWQEMFKFTPMDRLGQTNTQLLLWILTHGWIHQTKAWEGESLGKMLSECVSYSNFNLPMKMKQARKALWRRTN